MKPINPSESARSRYSVPRLLLVVAGWCLSAPAWLTGVDLVLTLGEHPVPLFVISLFAVWHLTWWLTVGYWVFRRWYASLWGLTLVSALAWVAMSPHWAVVAWPMHLVLWVMALEWGLCHWRGGRPAD